MAGMQNKNQEFKKMLFSENGRAPALQYNRKITF